LIFVYGLLVLILALAVLLSVLVWKVGQARRASKQPNCSSCGNATLHLSTPGGLVDTLLTNWDCLPYRCEVCLTRQYRVVRAPESARED